MTPETLTESITCHPRLSSQELSRRTVKFPYRDYRADIDGLRGIAILLVVIYHGFRPHLPGGFVGVDVFFVISGFLITSIITQDLNLERFTFRHFYARRIRRIFPALAIVLFSTLSVGWLFLFPNEFENLGKHTWASTIFSANLSLWRDTSYFAPAAETKPLLHLWSLGVEEQFYLLFPTFLLFVWRFPVKRRLILVLLACVLSFAWCLYATKTHSSVAFFLIPSRMWELLVGVLLALGAEVAGFSGRVSTPTSLSLLGLILIVGGGLFLNETKIGFPGFWALVPTAGAALLIQGEGKSFINQRILGCPPLVGLGLISYPLYLWHVPLLVFGRILFPKPAAVWVPLGAIALSVLLAWATYRFLEIPIRQRQRGPRIIALLCGCLFIECAIGLCAHQRIMRTRLSKLTPVISAQSDWDFRVWRTPGREIGSFVTNGVTARTVLFIGDSHMEQVWPRVEFLLDQKERDRPTVEFTTLGAHPPLPGVGRVAEPGVRCSAFYDYAMGRARRHEVSTVVFTACWEWYFLGLFGDHDRFVPLRSLEKPRDTLRLDSVDCRSVFERFALDLEGLTAAGKKVFVILSTPNAPSFDPSALLRNRFSTQIVVPQPISRSEFETYVAPVSSLLVEAAKRGGANIINPLDTLCEGQAISGFSGIVPKFKDSNHFTASFARAHATFIDVTLQ